MVWMSEFFEQDKRFLKLQLKRGKIKRKSVEEIQAVLPDVSEKAEFMRIDTSAVQDERADGETGEVEE